MNHFLRTTTVFVFSLSLVFCANTLAQNSETRAKMKDLPEAVRKTVQEQSKGVTLRGLTKEVKDGKTYYEAELRVKGHTRDVLIDSSGAVAEIEEEVAMSSLPPDVKATIVKNAGKGKINFVESITKNNSIEAYEAHVTKAGKKSEIKVDPAGKLISVEDEQEEKEEKAAGKKAAQKTRKP